MFVKVECTGKEYDELVKQLKEEKISFTTEITKQTMIDYFEEEYAPEIGNGKNERTSWRYVVRFEIHDKLI